MTPPGTLKDLEQILTIVCKRLALLEQNLSEVEIQVGIALAICEALQRGACGSDSIPTDSMISGTSKLPLPSGQGGLD
jgi:hypothetical protein